jgi:hypothetical protein
MNGKTLKAIWLIVILAASAPVLAGSIRFGIVGNISELQEASGQSALMFVLIGFGIGFYRLIMDGPA